MHLCTDITLLPASSSILSNVGWIHHSRKVPNPPSIISYLMSSKMSGFSSTLAFMRSFMATMMALALSSAPCLALFSAAPAGKEAEKRGEGAASVRGGTMTGRRAGAGRANTTSKGSKKHLALLDWKRTVYGRKEGRKGVHSNSRDGIKA